MTKAQPTPRIVPRVFAEDSGGYALPAKCTLCGHVIAKRALKWSALPGDPSGLKRPLHEACVREYRLFTRALDLPLA